MPAYPNAGIYAQIEGLYQNAPFLLLLALRAQWQMMSASLLYKDSSQPAPVFLHHTSLRLLPHDHAYLPMNTVLELLFCAQQGRSVGCQEGCCAPDSVAYVLLPEPHRLLNRAHRHTQLLNQGLEYPVVHQSKIHNRTKLDGY